MRTLPLENKLAASGATLGERYGTQIVQSCTGREEEYFTIRNSAGLTDFSFMQKYRVPEETGIDFLDKLVAGNAAKVRFGRMLHTFIADESGKIVSDCYVANNDEEFLVLCESIIDDASLNGIISGLGGADAGIEDITGNYVLLGIDGFEAWRVAKELFGADVPGLPYLSLEEYPYEDSTVFLFRAGKTSEFGYLILAPCNCAESLFDRLKELVEKYNGSLCGVDIHNDLRLEGRFFNIHAEGVRTGDPLPLGLQWMIDFEKEGFSGSGVIYKNRENGLRKKIIGIKAEPGCADLTTGAKVHVDTGHHAEVVADCYSYILNTKIGLALFPVETAFAGLQFPLGSAEGPVVETISMPPIFPKSLGVKLDEM
ncbi:MAG: hypothetical protein GF350_15625 [Chitinivibrionales bacterium]|nr:hypothetical protein [Chitinivibrionales bacterium]